MRKSIAMLVAALTLPMIAAGPADAGTHGKRGSFVAHALPFAAMRADIYYPEKGSCLGGVEGIHKVSEPFRAPARGALSVSIEGLSGDWDLYALGTRGRQLAASEDAQVLEGAEGEERVTVAVRRRQRVQMVACNWLGEPEVTVRFDFMTQTQVRERRHHHSGSATERKRATHKVNATGGPITPFWEWDPSELEIRVRDKVVWLNKTAADHHVTPYGGPWKDVRSKHLPIGDKARFVFRRPGEYLYRCDFAFAGVEHSLLVGDECVGMCGRIVVKKRR